MGIFLPPSECPSSWTVINGMPRPPVHYHIVPRTATPAPTLCTHTSHIHIHTGRARFERGGFDYLRRCSRKGTSQGSKLPLLLALLRLPPLCTSCLHWSSSNLRTPAFGLFQHNTDHAPCYPTHGHTCTRSGTLATRAASAWRRVKGHGRTYTPPSRMHRLNPSLPLPLPFPQVEPESRERAHESTPTDRPAARERERKAEPSQAKQR